MNSIIKIAAVASLLVGTPVLAQGDHDHGSSNQKHSGPHGGMMMNGMHQQHAEQMQEHMRVMREQIAQIRNEKDHKLREELLAEHLQAMEQHMDRMQPMMEMMSEGCPSRVHERPRS